MNRAEFTALPPAIALGILWDALEGVCTFDHIEVPKVPRAPKYDQRIGRKDGYQWASETHLDSLIWWRDKARESAMSGSQYAEKDAKKAEKLERWIEWRLCFPDKQWKGTRDDKDGVAKAPSHKPEVHAYEPRSAPQSDADEDYVMP